ncbi:hypothetical protein D9M72_541890 [compost metagenome]
MLQEMEHYRHRHVVREVCHEGGRFHGQFSDLHGIRQHQMEILGGAGPPLLHSARELGGEDRIDFDGDHGLCGVQQSQRQRTQSRTDLQDGLIGVDVRGGHDPADGIAVDDEVLAQCLRRPDSDLLSEPADIGGAKQCCGRGAGGGGDRFSHLGILSRWPAAAAPVKRPDQSRGGVRQRPGPVI